MLQGSIIIKQLYQQVCRIRPVHPLGNVFDIISLRLSGNGIAKHYFANRLSSEKADIVFFHRSDPVWNALFINLKTQFSINIRRMRKTEMTVDVPVQMLTGGIFYTFIQFY